MAKAKVQSQFMSVLSVRPFFILWVGQILTQLAMNMTLYLLGLVIYTKTGSNTAVSGLYIAYGIPSVLVGVLAGAIVDRLNKREVIIYSSFIRAILVGGLTIAIHSLPMTYVLLFLNAVITQFFVPAEVPYIPKVIKPEHLYAANSLFSVAYYTSMAIGFIAAGPMLRMVGLYPSLFFLMACFLLAGWIGMKLPDLDDNTISFSDALKRNFTYLVGRLTTSLKDGLSYVSKRPALTDSLILLTGTQIIYAMLGTLGPGFADRLLNIDIRDASVVIIGPVVVGMLAGAVWVGAFGHHFKSEKLIRSGIMSAGTVMILVSITVYLQRYAGWNWLYDSGILLPIELLMFFILGFANGLLDVPANSILQNETDGDMRGRVYGILAAAVGGVGIIPVVIGGVLADVIGVGKVIFTLGVIIVMYGIWRIRYNRGVRI